MSRFSCPEVEGKVVALQFGVKDDRRFFKGTYDNQ